MYARPGIAKLLRAPWNFEMDYDGQDGAIPILFTSPYAATRPAPGVPDVVTALDPEAIRQPAITGISPLLARMLPVPMGSTMLFYFPIVQDSHVGVLNEPCWAYVWRVIFRLRTLADFQRRKRARVGWSVPLSRLGTADTRTTRIPNTQTAVGGQRFIRPASAEAVIYNRSAPTPAESSPYFGTLTSDAVKIPFTADFTTQTALYPGWSLDATPLTVTKTMDYEQGERDPATVPLAGIGSGMRYLGPSHLPKFLKCVGNECAVECFKFEIDRTTGAVLQPRAWAFGVDPVTHLPDPTAEDAAFSRLLGIGALGEEAPSAPPTDTGVRLITGAFPQ
jgi:hypothetical protein